MYKYVSDEVYPTLEKGNLSFPVPSENKKLWTWTRTCVKYWMGRCFWILSFSISLICAVWMIREMCWSYMTNPIITIFNPSDIPVGILPFPAVTICNINNVQKSKMDEYLRRATKPNLTDEELIKAYSDLHNINHICRSARTFTERLSEDYERVTIDEKLLKEMNRRKLDTGPLDPTPLLREASQSCSEMVLFCVWMDEIQNCSSLFHEVETDYGYCCTFNLIPLTLLLRSINVSRDQHPKDIHEWKKANLDTESMLLENSRIQHSNEEAENYPDESIYPRRQIYAGRSSGLSILLFTDLDEYNCTNTDSEGFLLSLNLPLDFPRMRDNAIAIPSGSEVFINIKPELTIPDDSIRGFNLEKRKCYFGDEFKLKHYVHYTTSNCVDECLANWTLYECDCVQYYMPKSGNETVCSPRKYDCTENVRTQIIQKGIRKKCEQCLPTCTDLEYSSETTHLKIKESALTKMMHDLKWRRKLNPRDMSIVHLYFGMDSTYPRQRKEIYGVIELLSNAGGLLSLFVGFSVMKILKWSYNFIVRLTCNKKEGEQELDMDSDELEGSQFKLDTLQRLALNKGKSNVVTLVKRGKEPTGAMSRYKNSNTQTQPCYFTTVHIG